jgi:glycogen operon protein
MIIRWINPSGEDQTEEQWQDAGLHCIGLLLDGSEISDPAFEKDEGGRRLLIVFNSYHDTVSFKLPEVEDEGKWHRLLHTQAEEQGALYPGGEDIEVEGRSLMLLALASGS